MHFPTPQSPVPCPRCGRPSAGAFDASGVCVRCAGAQIFSLTVADKPGSTPPIPGFQDSDGPKRIGPYAILSELGRGGMGVVYLAQHEQLGRIVALKVIPAGGGATSDLEMRFLREARTIARLSHPHIVTVHDAGRDRGHAYFSMDYFEEGDLARRLRGQAFSPREAATLLRNVTEAIAYSHAEGVLHRDLKPSNIMLAAGAPRVADFGLAAELDSSSGLTARTAIIGTPHYLAPEALSGGSAAQGVASDIYALGVILHEMLAGRTPFAGASPAELPGLLAQRGAPALRLLAPHVPVDLAIICAKCLEFAPADRYASATALAEDLRRYLAGEPIVARPVSVGSQLFRWARRRPAIAATWILSVLLAVASLTAAIMINQERQRANQEARASAALADFLRMDLLAQASFSNEPDRDLKLRTALDRAVERIPARFTHAPLAEADIRFSLGSTYYSLAEYERAEQQFRRSMILRRHFLGPEETGTMHATVELAASLNSLGRSEDAASLVRSARTTLTRVAGPDHPASINALEVETLVERSLGHLVRAEEIARNALSRARRALGADDELTREAMVNESTLLSQLGKTDEGEKLSREVVTIAERVLGPNNPRTLGYRASLAGFATDQGRAQAAEPELRRLHEALTRQLGPDHPETLRTLGLRGGANSKLQRYAEAETIFTTLVATRRRVIGNEHPLTLAAIKLLAIAKGRNGHLDGAIDLMRELAATSARTLGPEHLNTLAYGRNLAAMLLSARRYPEALEPARTAYETNLRQFGPTDPSTLADAEVYANALGFAGRYEESVPILRQAVKVLVTTEPDHWRTFMDQGQLGKALARAGHPAEAEALLIAGYDGVRAHQSQLPPSRRHLPSSYAAELVQVCTALGRPAAAAEWQARVTADTTTKR